MAIEFFTRRSWGVPGAAGRFGITWGSVPTPRGESVPKYALHLIVSRSSWVWGYEVHEYDGIHPSIGLGPLFLLAWWG